MATDLKDRIAERVRNGDTGLPEDLFLEVAEALGVSKEDIEQSPFGKDKPGTSRTAGSTPAQTGGEPVPGAERAPDAPPEDEKPTRKSTAKSSAKKTAARSPR